MKDVNIVLKGSNIKLEITVFLGCLLFAFLVNIYAILKFGSPWYEVVTSLHYVLGLTVAAYVVIGILRLIVQLLKLVFNRVKRRTLDEST